MSILINPARFRLGADTAIGRLLGDEPSGLALDFTTMQALVRDDSFPVTGFLGDVNSLLTYTAPSPKMIWNVAGTLVSGSTIRCDHDPVTHAPLGVLIEEQRTNFSWPSQAFDNAAWTKDASTVVANATAAPDGTVSADSIADNAVASTHAVYKAEGLTAAQYTFSVFLKKGTHSKLLFSLATASLGIGAGVPVDLVAGTLGTLINYGAHTGATASIKSVGNDWHRVSITVLGTVTTWYTAVWLTNASYNRTYSGTGTFLYVWGAQLEAGVWPSSYVPTVASQVTRAGDNLSLPAASMPLSAIAGTVVIEGRTPVGSGTQAIWQIDDTTSAERLLIHRNTGGELHAVVIDGGASQCDINLGVVTNSTAFKVAFAWAAGDFAATLNGGTVGTDAAGTLPAVTMMRFGRDHLASEWNGYIETVTYLPRRASNADLQRMSS